MSIDFKHVFLPYENLDSMEYSILFLCNSISLSLYRYTSGNWFSIFRFSRKRSIEIHAVINLSFGYHRN
jgi:hypothetical protein